MHILQLPLHLTRLSIYTVRAFNISLPNRQSHGPLKRHMKYAATAMITFGEIWNSGVLDQWGRKAGGKKFAVASLTLEEIPVMDATSGS